MNKKEMLKALNYFLLLEKQQVELYGSQSKSTDDYELAKFLQRFSQIELEHVHKITRLIIDLGGKPSPNYEFAGTILGEGVKIAGAIFAGYTKIENMLKMNILGEKLAIRDYKRLINRVTDPRLENILWKHLIDEELHMKWMEARVKEIRMKRKAITNYRNNAKKKPTVSRLV